MAKVGLMLIILSMGLISLLWLPTAVSGGQVTVQQPRDDSDPCSYPNPLALKVVRDVIDDVTLSLTTNQNIRVPHRVVLMRADADTEQTVFEPVEIPQTTVAYHSSENMACFVVECLKDTQNNATIYMFNGTFFIGDAMYQLHPHDQKAVVSPDYISQVYVMEHVDESKGATDYDYVKAPAEEGEFVFNASSSRTRTNSRDKRQAAVINYYIDVLPVIDYSLYSRWLSSHSYNANQAVSAIVSYFTNIFTGIALRFNTLNLHNNIVLNIQMVTPYISTDPTTSKFTEDHRIYLGDGRFFVNIENQLYDFSDWTRDTPGLPVNDHAMLFSGYQWYGIDVHDTSIVILGAAWLDNTCTKSGKASSVVQERMGYESEHVATHELGHNLGSGHDGSGNLCEPEDKYIMAPSAPSRMYEHDMHNPFKFSTCSSDQISDYVEWLEARTYKTTCLTASNGTALPDVPPKTVRIESICPTAFGDESRLCLFLDRFPLRQPYVCKSISCKTVSGGCSHVVPPTGMCCANGKYCIEGICTDAPEGECVLDEECPFQDAVSFCPSYIGQNFSKCQNEVIRTYCCHSCSELMKTVTAPPNPPKFSINGLTLTNNTTLQGELYRSLSVVCQVHGGTPEVSNITMKRPGYHRTTIPGAIITVRFSADPSFSPVELNCSAQHISGKYNQTTLLSLDITRQTQMKCDPSWHFYNAENVCIKRISWRRNFKKARKLCQASGADLVTLLKDSQQRAFVKGLARRWQRHIVGINDWDRNGEHHFLDGSPMNGTSITKIARSKQCVVLFKDQLVASKCSIRNRFICQKAALGTYGADVHVTLQSQ